MEQRVIRAAESVLEDQKYVSAVDIFLRIGWLNPEALRRWRQGGVRCLEEGVRANLRKISLVMAIFRRWAFRRGLKPSETSYLKRTKGPREELTFSKSGSPELERSCRTHYISPELSQRKQAILREKLHRQPEFVVFWARHPSRCFQCQEEMGSGRLLFLEQGEPLCLGCAGLDHLVFLPRGDSNLTRLARSYSSRYAVVVRFSRTRKRYERQGLLVETQALGRAEAEVRSQDSSQKGEPKGAVRRAKAAMEALEVSEGRAGGF
ncbi:MAG: hypothetical protein HYZ73_09880 [Elusimicrobia bacterium]|nr:hypothetical protein [Elusimicrobiota bacterium]